jgi:hypothetical protein
MRYIKLMMMCFLATVGDGDESEPDHVKDPLAIDYVVFSGISQSLYVKQSVCSSST